MQTATWRVGALGSCPLCYPPLTVQAVKRGIKSNRRPGQSITASPSRVDAHRSDIASSGQFHRSGSESFFGLLPTSASAFFEIRNRANQSPGQLPLKRPLASRGLDRAADQALTALDCVEPKQSGITNSGLLPAQLPTHDFSVDEALNLDKRNLGQSLTSSPSRVKAYRSDIASSGTSITSGPTVVETWKTANRSFGQSLPSGLAHVDVHSLGIVSPGQSHTPEPPVDEEWNLVGQRLGQLLALDSAPVTSRRYVVAIFDSHTQIGARDSSLHKK